MKCPKCQTENPDTQKFCGECGAKFELVCHQSGNANPSKYKFCGECGQQMEGEFVKKAAETEKKVTEAEGERKHVTVLFSDLSGYTAMSEKMDPLKFIEYYLKRRNQLPRVVFQA